MGFLYIVFQVLGHILHYILKYEYNGNLFLMKTLISYNVPWTQMTLIHNLNMVHPLTEAKYIAEWC